ncbi:MAG: site-specific integrase [Caldilineaceae bacterium]|nr:site-specific integrase [Caldilineaceae bacterium]
MTTPDPIESDFFEQLRNAALAYNTRIAYDKGWRSFCGYCHRQGIQPLSATPEEVAGFFIEIATQPSPASGRILSLGTLTLYRSAINRRFVDANKVSPTAHSEVVSVLKGLARLRGGTTRQVKALREHHIAAMLKICPDTLIGRRDAAFLAIGFAAALRRSELCNLKVGDIEWMQEGLLRDSHSGIVIHIRKSKTDQFGTGQRVAVPEGKKIRPVARLRSWLKSSGIQDGYLFQTMRKNGSLTGSPLHHTDIPRLVKHYAAAIGLNAKDFSAHSLRAGFVTSAAAHHARLDKIMEITRHTNPATVMKYIRDADAFTDHAGAAFL